MANLYSIKDWAKHFEKSQARECKQMNWVPLPVKHDGLGFRRIMALSDGPAIFGAWVLIVQVAAKCPVRGVLADETGPLSPDDLHLKTGCPASLFAKVLEITSSKEVAWMLVERCQDTPSVLPPTGQDKTEQENTGQDTCAPPNGGCQPSGLASWLSWWNGLHVQRLVSARVETSPPSQAICRAWKRVEKSREVRELLSNRDKLETEIRASAFLREPWFRLEKLLGGKNRDGEYIARKVLEGGYKNKAIPNGRSRQGAGVNYDPDATYEKL